MMKYFAAVALASIALAAFAHPASAVTFPSLTTIYVGSGVVDSGDAPGQGVATSIHCSNVSGIAAQVRVLVLGAVGTVRGVRTETLAHGATVTFSTHETGLFVDGSWVLDTGAVFQGVVNVETTNSAVFCTAVVYDAENIPPAFMSPVHLVRVNPHPGTVE